MGDRVSSKRKRRGDKISSKKKSRRRKESKKRHRRSYDSVSSSSDDDSLYLEHRSSTSKTDHRRRLTKTNKHRHDSPLSDSDSSSSEDNDYKTRKARRPRVGLKDIKRKRRKRSTSTIGDVDATGGRKRKRSGKDNVIRPTKKSSKKKSRRVLSSSSGSDSKSFPSSQSGSSSSSGDDKHRKNKVVPDKEKERLRRRQSRKGKDEDRSPSCTSIGRGADPSFSVGISDRELFPVDNSRRLRSVIAVADRARDEEENRWEMDPNKEEIVYDQKDYPSPRSLDSNEGGSKMESGNQLNVELCVENIAGDEVCELGKSRIDDGDHHQLEGYINNSEEKEIGISVTAAALGGDALESILRQKALENLRKFRKMPQTSPRDDTVKRYSETNVATLSDRTADIFENNSIEQGISNAQEMNQSGGLLLQREIAEVVKLPDSEHIEDKPRMADPSITPSGNGSAIIKCLEEDKSSRSPVEVKAVSGDNTSPGAGVTKACSSSNVAPTSGEHSSVQTKESSQFEQKTMTVMRGGKLVQVSYKVYIPKKTPALARRQLKR